MFLGLWEESRLEYVKKTSGNSQIRETGSENQDFGVCIFRTDIVIGEFEKQVTETVCLYSISTEEFGQIMLHSQVFTLH